MDIITEEFKEALRQAVEERAGEPVIIEPVLKNNGVKLNGLSISNGSYQRLPSYFIKICPVK